MSKSSQSKVSTRGREKQECAMTALRKILVEEEPVVASETLPTRTAKLYVVASNAAEEPAEAGESRSALTNIALFFAAPFIGLVYVIALPFVGLGYLAVLAVRTVARYPAARTFGLVCKNVGMIAAAPVIGLAYFMLFPAIGLVALLWVGGRAALGAR
jgi:hypothetical protein